jgi:HK97 gp10 family phage protein
MADAVILEGWKELETKLLGLSAKIAKNVLRTSVYAGAAVMKEAVKAKAPLLTGKTWGIHQPAGTLKRSIIVKHIPEQSGLYQQTYKVTVKQGKRYQGQGKKQNRSQDAFYARWVEHGHWYVPPNPNSSNGSTPLNPVQHKANWKEHRSKAKNGSEAKWIPAHPFMRPAWDATNMQSLEVIKTRMGQKIEEEAAK